MGKVFEKNFRDPVLGSSMCPKAVPQREIPAPGLGHMGQVRGRVCAPGIWAEKSKVPPVYKGFIKKIRLFCTWGTWGTLFIGLHEKRWPDAIS